VLRGSSALLFWSAADIFDTLDFGDSAKFSFVNKDIFLYFLVSSLLYSVGVMSGFEHLDSFWWKKVDLVVLSLSDSFSSFGCPASEMK
jgi:hypothetical protein